MEAKPNLFVVSSTESLNIAYAVQENLEDDADVTVWNQGVFTPSTYTLEAIIKATQKCNFGVFIFSPDDIVVIRDQEKKAVRDNVIFELGLFIGRLGKNRCFIIKPREEQDLDLPSDLLGLTLLTFSTTRSDSNIRASLGPACNQIRQVMEELGTNLESMPYQATTSTGSKHEERDSKVVLTSWIRENINGIINRALFFEKIDEDLNLFPGTSKNHLKEIASKMNLVVVEESENTIMYKRGPAQVRTLGRKSRFDGL